MEHKQIINELQQGICEITWTDSFSVEHSVMGTLSTNHLNEDFPNLDLGEKNRNSVAFWDVNAEKWMVDKVNIDNMEEFLYDEYYGGEEKPQWI